jgi:RNA polymerase sigma-70 factor (ECF subfamily)
VIAQSSDSEVVAAAAPFSAHRWSLLVPHRQRLLRIAGRRVASPQDAEDCVHEALLRAAAFPPLDEARVGQFLTTTVLRLCVDLHRARARADRAFARCDTTGNESPPDEWICDQDEGNWLLGQVETLRGRERQVLLARAAGKSTREAAADLAISVKAAEGAFTRGRARLIALCQV